MKGETRLKYILLSSLTTKNSGNTMNCRPVQESEHDQDIVGKVTSLPPNTVHDIDKYTLKLNAFDRPHEHALFMTSSLTKYTDLQDQIHS